MTAVSPFLFIFEDFFWILWYILVGQFHVFFFFFSFGVVFSFSRYHEAQPLVA